MPSPPDFSSQRYWSTRFESEQSFEWLLPSSQILDIVVEHSSRLKEGDRVLHFGCGTSTLGRDIKRVLDGLEVIDADYAASSLPPRQLDDVQLIDVDLLSPDKDIGIFGLLIDKSTADAISCGPNLPHPLTSDTVEPIVVLCHNLGKIVEKGGKWICISYSASRFDWEVEKEGWRVVEKRGSKGWSASLSKEEIEDIKEEVQGQGGKKKKKKKEERVVYEPEVGVWVYILERI